MMMTMTAMMTMVMKSVEKGLHIVDKHDKNEFSAKFPLVNIIIISVTHLKSSKVCRQVVLLEGGGVEGDGVGQVDLPRLDLRHHVHQVQNLVRPFEKVGSIISKVGLSLWLAIYMEFNV